MKLVKAIIKPEKLPDVKKELAKENIIGMTVYDVHGCGQQKGYTEEYRGVVHEVNLLRKVVIEIVVEDALVNKMVDAIIKGARTGKIGDGKIFVLNVDESIKIRTKEKGEKALKG
ncbi:P-II family nitrogen regulator [Candidatus Pacearchaeota archaeon]|nr:P-II family nitrogen regulator [Candidatus Pacearchaeota archaeon]